MWIKPPGAGPLLGFECSCTVLYRCAVPPKVYHVHKPLKPFGLEAACISGLSLRLVFHRDSPYFDFEPNHVITCLGEMF